MRLYLDVCCLNRFLDDLSQERIRRESDAVRRIIELCSRGAHVWVASDMIVDEVRRTPDSQRRAAVLAVLREAQERFETTAEVFIMARAYDGLMAVDAIHLALAELGRCDVLLTTDDDFLQKATKLVARVRVRVENPVTWIGANDL